MHGLSIHLWVYAAINALMVFGWLLTTGSVDDLQACVTNPTTALDRGFWPVWPIAIGATALIIHFGVLFSNGAFGLRARRRRRRRRREIKKAWDHTTAWAEAMATDAVSSATGSTRSKRDRSRRRRRHEPATEHAARPLRQDRAAPSDGHAHRWVTVMFTDIADSTPLTETLGDDAWHEVLADHRDLVRDCVADHGGEEVSTQGDGFFVRYDAVSDGLACAVELQRRLASRRGDGAFTPEIRIGLHAGEVLEEAEGDLLGHVVNVASRVTDAARAGEILITESVADRAGGGIDLDDRGLQQLKGLGQARHILAVQWSGADLRRESDPRP